MTDPTRFVADASLWQRADARAEAAVGGQLWYAALDLAVPDRVPAEADAGKEASDDRFAEHAVRGLLVVARSTATKAWALRSDQTADAPVATIAVALEVDEFDHLQRMLEERPRAVQFDFRLPEVMRSGETDAGAADELLDWHFWVNMHCGADAARHAAGEDASAAAAGPAVGRQGPPLTEANLAALADVFGLTPVPREPGPAAVEQFASGGRARDAGADLSVLEPEPALHADENAERSAPGHSEAAIESGDDAALPSGPTPSLAVAITVPPPAAAAMAVRPTDSDATVTAGALPIESPSEPVRTSPRRRAGAVFGLVALLLAGAALFLADRQSVPTVSLESQSASVAPQVIEHPRESTPQPIAAPPAPPVAAEEPARAAPAAPPDEEAGADAAAATEQRSEPSPPVPTTAAAPAEPRGETRSAPPAAQTPMPARAAPPRVRPATESSAPPKKSARTATASAVAATTSPGEAGAAPPSPRAAPVAEPAPRQEPAPARPATAPADPCAGLPGLRQAQCRACRDVIGVGRYACEQAQITRYCAGKWGEAPDCPWGSGTAMAGDASVKP